MPPTPDPEDKLLTEAADWVVTLNYGQPTQAERLAFDAWRRRSPAHDAAWRRVGTVLQAFGQVPPDIGRQALAEIDKGWNRRRVLRGLSVLAVAAPAAWLAGRQLPWQRWSADLTTGIGEQRSIVLPDGSQVVLDTASAVDVDFSGEARRLCLKQGRVLVTAIADDDPASRPFLVESAQVVLSTREARFVIHDPGDAPGEIAVLDRAVEVRPHQGPARVVRGPGQAGFDRVAVAEPMPLRADPLLWSRGLLLAIDRPLAEVLTELARYRPGVLRWDPAVASLRVSGTLTLGDTDAGLRLLARTLPIRIVQRTRYWVTVVPRS